VTSLVEHLRVMARNNAWANHRLLNAAKSTPCLPARPLPPPQLDEFFLEQDAPLRAEEMRALGWAGG
jgi:hypothetical protein